MGSEWLTAADFAYDHPYISRIFLRRSAFDTLLYRDLKVTTGFAFEDWDFNCRLLAEGYEFRIAPKTVIFYRQRANSLLKQARNTSANIVPHSRLFEPKYFRSAMQSAREKNSDWQEFIRTRQ